MSPDVLLFQILRERQVPFVVVGGHAVNYHGFRRATEDVDVVWIRSPESEILLAQAMIEIEACYIGREIDPATGIEKLHPVSLPYIQSRHLMMLWTKYGFLDLFDYIPGHPDLDAQVLWDTSELHEGLRYASLDMLRKMKLVAGRDKDLDDLKKLAELHQTPMGERLD